MTRPRKESKRSALAKRRKQKECTCAVTRPLRLGWRAVHVAESLLSLLLEPSKDDGCNMNDDGRRRMSTNAKKCWYASMLNAE
jgi:hypothetical protein